MKITKISDTQVKFVLTKADLDERNIDINDLAEEMASGTGRTHQLIQEITRQVLAECGFPFENKALMMELVSVDTECVMIMVTRLEISDLVQKLDVMTLAGVMEGMKAAFRMRNKWTTEHKRETEDTAPLSLFSFARLDDISAISVRLHHLFTGISRLYKSEGRYYLLLQYQKQAPALGDDETETVCQPKEALDKSCMDTVEAILSEYGQRHIVTPLSQHYLLEHGEVLIQENAIEKLAAF